MADPPKRLARVFRPGPHAERKKGKVVSAYELRKLFSSQKILKRHAAGELTAHFIYNQPASPDFGQFPGTMSQLIAYRDKNGKTVAETHRFVEPGGQLGASQQEDPKKLLMPDGVIYYTPL